MWATIFLFANIKRGFYHLGDSCSNVLNKINIISAAGLWGINVSDEYCLFRMRVVLEMCFYLSPILHNFVFWYCRCRSSGLNISDNNFLVRGRVIFGDVFLFIPNIAKFPIERGKKSKINIQTVQINLQEKKER